MAVVPAAQEQQGFDPARMYLWLKALESKVNNLLREMDMLKNDFVKKNSQLKKDLKVALDDLVEVKRSHEKMQQMLDLMIKELKQTAGIEEVMTIRKYMDLWNPLSFVTQRDLERMVDAKLQLSKSKESIKIVELEQKN